MLWPMSSTRPRVLIVEDDAGVRQALERGLTRDFETTSVASGGEALRVADHDIAIDRSWL
jgi:CheY-like chemotaxis protein